MNEYSTNEVRPAIYAQCFRAQLGAFGALAQARLRKATILHVGTGGVGTSCILTEVDAGIGCIAGIDPQRFEIDNFNRFPFARAEDVGTPKVELLARFFAGRQHFTFMPVFAPCESAEVEPLWAGADLIVSASNTVSSRVHTMRRAYEHRKLCVSVAVADARVSRTGQIVVWRPDAADFACPVCFLPSAYSTDHRESLTATVTHAIGALAAGLVVRLLLGGSAADFGCNVLSVDLDAVTVERLTVRRRASCPVCSSANCNGSR